MPTPPPTFDMWRQIRMTTCAGARLAALAGRASRDPTRRAGFCDEHTVLIRFTTARRSVQ